MNKNQTKSTNCWGLIISEVFPPRVGGSGKWLFDIYRHQEPGRYVVVSGDHHEAAAVDETYPQQVIRCDLSMKSRALASLDSIRAYLNQVRDIRKHVRKHRPCIIHASRPLSEGLVAAIVSKLTGVPFLCFVHGEDVSVAKSSRELSILTKFVLRSTKSIIANSNYTRAMLENDWSIAPSKIHLMHPGIDCDRFDKSCKSNDESEDRGRLRLMTAGRLQKRKGHDTVIKAVATLREKFPAIEYSIAGTGEEEPSLRKLAKDLGVTDHVHFLGEVSDEELVSQYHQNDIFVLANRDIDGDVEGFGIVLLEAQACGKPVIAGRSGGTADTLIDGETGFLIDAKNETKLVELISSELSSPETRRGIGEMGKSHVIKNFDWSVLRVQAEFIFSPSILER